MWNPLYDGGGDCGGGGNCLGSGDRSFQMHPCHLLIKSHLILEELSHLILKSLHPLSYLIEALCYLLLLLCLKSGKSCLLSIVNSLVFFTILFLNSSRWTLTSLSLSLLRSEKSHKRRKFECRQMWHRLKRVTIRNNLCKTIQFQNKWGEGNRLCLCPSIHHSWIFTLTIYLISTIMSLRMA